MVGTAPGASFVAYRFISRYTQGQMSVTTSPGITQPTLLGFDPGRDKCGLAIMGVDRTLHYHQVIASREVLTYLETLRQQYPIALIVMGDQTGAKTWRRTLETLADLPNIILVDERYSSLEARERYWQMYPPKGLNRLLPQGMRTVPRPIDDIVAILLIERYLNRLATQPG
jgi:RNase H-fold protein (predicted Holliday junction resolvase)